MVKMSEDMKFIAKMVLLIAVVSIVLSGCVVGYLKVWPVLRGMWFEGYRAGNEYISTQESMLYMMMADYEDLEVQKASASDPAIVAAIEGQQAAIIDRMERGVGTIEGHVPTDIARFLAQH
jgi:hypothetical protein